MEIFGIMCVAFGVITLLSTLAFGFIGSDAIEVPWFSLPVFAASTAVFGFADIALSLSGISPLNTILFGLLAAGVTYICGFWALKTLTRYSIAEVSSVEAEIGLIGTVHIAIPSGSWGQITFRNREGILSTVKAQLSDRSASVEKGQKVLIIGAEENIVFVEEISGLEIGE